MPQDAPDKTIASRFAQTEPVIKYDISGSNFHAEITPEAKQILEGVGWRAARNFVEQAIETCLEDPFGEMCIDSQANTNVGAKARIVHRLGDEAESAFGVPIAIKGTGLDPESVSGGRYGQRIALPDQFRFMHRLHAAQTKLYPDGMGGLFFVNRPLALISHWLDNGQRAKMQHWMLSERVIGEPVKDRRFNSERPRGIYFFVDFDTYPDIAEFVRANDVVRSLRENTVSFRYGIDRVLESMLKPAGIPSQSFQDLRGRNVIQAQHGGRNKYVIIDLQ